MKLNRSADGTGPVFVDPTGRRRRLFTVAGTVVGIVLAGSIALLVAGLFGASPVPLPGLPSSGEGAQHGEPVVPAGVRPSGGPSTPVGSAAGARPARTGGARVAPSVVAPAASSAPPSRAARGNRPTTHPGNPKPGKSK